MGAFADGFINLVSRIGTRSDKAAYNTYGINVIVDQAEIDAAYRTSWFRKIVDIPAFDATREWLTWQADDPQIELIEAEQTRLMVIQKVRRALSWARKDGGAAIFMGGLPGAPETPLDINRVGKGSLQYLTVFEKSRITIGEQDDDVLSPTYGLPRKYSVNAQDIHPSRILRFIGNEVQDFQANWTGWGDSIWHTVRQGVVNSDAIAAAVSALVQEAKVDVFKLKNLANNLVTAETETKLLNRFSAMNTLKSIQNALVIDADDEYEQKTITFAGLTDIQITALMIMSGLADIPATRLLGQAPQGLNATGESDMRNYYDMISARQEMEITPTIDPLIECLIRSSIGSRPPEIYTVWNPLWQLSASDAATVEKSFADGLTARVNTGIFDDVVLAKAELNRMTESGQYPGIEAAIAESAEDDGIKDPDEVDAKAIERMTIEAEIAANSKPQRVAANDAEPKSLYVRRDVMNAKAIRDFYVKQGIDVVPVEKMHVTVIYSRSPVDWFSIGDAWEDEIKLPKGGARDHAMFGPPGVEDTLVLMIKSSSLEWRNAEFIRQGCVSSYDEYQPHISLSKYGEGAKIDMTKLTPWIGPIVLGPEIFEEAKP